MRWSAVTATLTTTLAATLTATLHSRPLPPTPTPAHSRLHPLPPTPAHAHSHSRPPPQVRSHANQLLEQPWQYVVLDEGHKIRNPHAEITQA